MRALACLALLLAACITVEGPRPDIGEEGPRDLAGYVVPDLGGADLWGIGRPVGVDPSTCGETGQPCCPASACPEIGDPACCAKVAQGICEAPCCGVGWCDPATPRPPHDVESGVGCLMGICAFAGH